MKIPRKKNLKKELRIIYKYQDPMYTIKLRKYISHMTPIVSGIYNGKEIQFLVS